MVKISCKNGVESGYYTCMLIHDFIFQTAKRYPERTAYWLRTSLDVKPLSYSALVVRITRIAAGLQELGVKEGTRVGIYAPNSPEWGMVYLGILAAGGTVVPLDPQAKYLELRSIITRSAMSHLFCSFSSYGDLMELKSMSAPYPEVIAIDPPSDSVVPIDLTLQKIEELGIDKTLASRATRPEDLAVIIFTSGTSGDSKGVMLSHQNIVSDIEAVYPRLPIGPDDIFLSVLPLHHTFESTCGLLFPLSVGASIVYVTSLKSTDLLADLKQFRATLMCGVPLLYEKMYGGIQRALQKKSLIARLYVELGQRLSDVSKALVNRTSGRLIFRALRRKAGLDSVRMMVSGGAALDPEISRFFNNLGIPLLQGYGLTETSPVLSVNDQTDNRYSAVGRPLDGVEVKILDANEAGIGEIAVRGKMVMMGYFENPEATAEVMREGFFATGDLGYVDKDGFIHITGRKKNVIITPAGKNIYPEEIEAVIDASPYVLECAVLPRPRGTGQEPIAVIVPDYEYIAAENNGNQPDDEAIREVIRTEVLRHCDQLAEFKRVKDVIIMTEELPKTSTRKVRRFVLLDTLQKLGQL